MADLTDDFAGSAVTTGAVALGGSATGNIETTGDKDWFKVSLVAGETYHFTLQGSDTGQGTLSTPFLQLLNPAGSSLLQDADGGGYAGAGEGYSSTLTYTATQTGTYFLEASSLTTHLGTYTVAASVVPGVTDDFAGSTVTTGAVALGGSATGNIETTGDKDWFKVSLVAGETYHFTLQGSDTGQGTLSTPFLQLLNPAGSSLLQDADGGGYGGAGEGYSSTLTYTATQTGTYFLEASSLTTHLGTYTVAASVVPGVTDDFAGSAVTTGAVALGGSATGNIETTGDKDWFKVSLVAGETYHFTLQGSDTGQGTLSTPFLQLLNPAGSSLLQDADGGGYGGAGEGYSSTLTYTATQTGTYFLEASSLTTHLGTYTVGASVVPGVTDDFAGSAVTTGAVALGGSATGNIETTGDKDWFKVSLVAGETYHFTLQGSDTGQGTLSTPFLQLLNPAGSSLLQDADGGGYAGAGEGYSSTLTYTATQTGTYFLEASSLTTHLGTYTVGASVVPGVTDDFAGSAVTTGAVALGGSATGNIETTGDKDWFKVSLVAGETYHFTLQGSDTGQGTLSTPFLQLLNPAGSSLLQDADGGGYAGAGEGYSSTLTYTATQTGTYFLEASSLTTHLGTYTVGATNLTPSPPPPPTLVLLGNGGDTFTDVADRSSIINGQNGNDRLEGMARADQLHGGKGSDTLDGGTGDDWLYGDNGEDRLIGGDGADTFVFAKSGGADIVLDFQVGVDHLHLDGVSAKTATLVDVDHAGALDLVVQFSNGSVTLLNVGAVQNWQDLFS